MRKETKSPTTAERKTEEKKKIKKKKKRNSTIWTKEEHEKLFRLYKHLSTAWPSITKEFPGKTEIQVKNYFYSTLRRVATKQAADRTWIQRNIIRLGKRELVKHVDQAHKYGHDCFSKRGRKPKILKDTQIPETKILEKISDDVEISGSQLTPRKGEANSHHPASYNLVPPMVTAVLYPQSLYQNYPRGVPLIPLIKEYENHYTINSAPVESRIFNMIPIPYMKPNSTCLSLDPGKVSF